MNKIIFFETQPDEIEAYKKAYPEAQLLTEHLSQENIEKYKDAEYISCHVNSLLNSENLSLLPNLKFISTRTTGYDHIDLVECKKRSIVVCNVPDYGSRTVAEFTFALLLCLTRKLPASIEQSKKCNFNHAQIKGIDLYGKTIGLVGFGKIGSVVAEIANGFGMKILAHCRNPKITGLPVTFVSLGELLSQSDVVSLHVPYSPETHHVINKENVLSIKKGAYLINTARGGVIETEAILLALKENVLAGVGLDVFEEEKDLTDEMSLFAGNHQLLQENFKTLCMDHLLINHPKVIATPHNAFNTTDALARIAVTTIENIKKFQERNPQNTVS